ncbi:hypothetical protein BH11PSE7_BH11PSE7_10950 [soil metagenome]
MQTNTARGGQFPIHQPGHQRRPWLALPALLLTLALTACGGGNGTAAADALSAGTTAPTTTTTAVVTSTTAITTSGIGPGGGTVELPQGAKLVIPAGALSGTVSIAISTNAADTGSAPSIASGVTATGAVFALLPHGTTFAGSVTLTVPFDPSLIPPGVTPRLYKAEPGGGYTEIPSTVVGTTLVAQISGFSWVQGGISGKPDTPQVLAELDDTAVRVSWTGVAGESYQVCKDATPSVVLAGQSFYPSQCTSASPPYTFTGLTNGTNYSFAVVASNSAGQAESTFATVAPKALARTWASYDTGYYDPYASEPATYGAGNYNDVAYLRKGGSDYYVAVKSTHQTMRIVDGGDPVHNADQTPVLYTLRAIAGGNGFFIAVGDNGTIGYSGDGGLRWTYAQMGQFTGEFAYKAVAYVPAALNRPGRFVAVGSWFDSYGLAHDLITTIDPTVGSTGISSFLPGIYHQKFQESSLPYAVNAQGVIVGNSQDYYSTYVQDVITSHPGGISYKVTGNLEAGTASGVTVAQTLLASNAFSSSYGASIRVVFFNNKFWGLANSSGGSLSSDGVTWPIGSSNSFQIHNPRSATTGFTAGPSQLVAVSANGEFFYNGTGGNNVSSFTSVNGPTNDLGDSPRVIYGNGRYISVGKYVIKSD